MTALPDRRITSALAPRIAGMVFGALLVAACAASPAPPAATQPSTMSSADVSQPPAASAGASQPGAGPSQSGALAGQTDTDWGRIWDTLPPSFPRYPGAKPSEATGPASATLVIPSDVQTATSWMKAALDAGEWVTVIGGPLEDGSMALQSTGAGAGCQVITKIAKVGGVTMMTIQYAAACPFK